MVLKLVSLTLCPVTWGPVEDIKLIVLGTGIDPVEELATRETFKLIPYEV